MKVDKVEGVTDDLKWIEMEGGQVRLAGRQLANPGAQNDKPWARFQVAVRMFMLRP